MNVCERRWIFTAYEELKEKARRLSPDAAGVRENIWFRAYHWLILRLGLLGETFKSALQKRENVFFVRTEMPLSGSGI